MNFAMTGHKGLIGSFLLKKLIERGDKPVLLVDTREGKNILDIGNYNLKDKIDVFIHLASFCKINKIIENPLLTFENNSKGMERIMEFCRKNEIPKMVFTSSSRILSKEKNPYTASKIYGEELVKGYFQCYGIDYVIIRPSTVYGPFNDKTKRLIDIWILNALKGEELKIYENEIAQPQEVELDIYKIKNLDFYPKFSIEEGIKRTFEWYKENFEEIKRSR